MRLRFAVRKIMEADHLKMKEDYDTELKGIFEGLVENRYPIGDAANKAAEEEFKGDPFFRDFCVTIGASADETLGIPGGLFPKVGSFPLFLITNETYRFDHGILAVMDIIIGLQERKKGKPSTPKQLSPVGKSSKKFMEAKEKGNQMFKEKRYVDALKFYNVCVVSAEENDRAVAHFNRSAALFYIKEFKLCLIDCLAAVDAKYPHPNRIENRITSTLQELELFKDYLTAPIEYARSIVNKIPDKREPLSEKWLDFVDISFERNKHLPAFSLKVDRNRVLIEDVPPGTILFEEDPFVCVQHPKYYIEFCHHCLREALVAVPCDSCCTIAFCSFDCRRNATYHHRECDILPTLVDANATFSVYMALRILSVEPLDDFILQTVRLFYSGHMEAAKTATVPFKFPDSIMVYNKSLSKESPVYDFLCNSYDGDKNISYERVACARFLFDVLKKSKFLRQPVTPQTVDLLVDSVNTSFSNLEYHIYFSLNQIFRCVYNGRTYSGSHPVIKTASLYSSGERIVGMARYREAIDVENACDPNVTTAFLHNRIVYISRWPIKAGSYLYASRGILRVGRTSEEMSALFESILDEEDCLCHGCDNYDWEDQDDLYIDCKKVLLGDKRALDRHSCFFYYDNLPEAGVCPLCFKFVGDGKGADCDNPACVEFFTRRPKPFSGVSYPETHTAVDQVLEALPETMKLEPYRVDKLRKLVTAILVVDAVGEFPNIPRSALGVKFDNIVRFLYSVAERYPIECFQPRK